MTENIIKIFKENGTNSIKWHGTALRCYKKIGDIYEIQALQTIGIMNVHSEFTKYGADFVHGMVKLNQAAIPKITTVKKNIPPRSKNKK